MKVGLEKDMQLTIVPNSYVELVALKLWYEKYEQPAVGGNVNASLVILSFPNDQLTESLSLGNQPVDDAHGKWISTVDRLPESGEVVIMCYDADGVPHMDFGYYMDTKEDDRGLWWFSPKSCLNRSWLVVGWMPAPGWPSGMVGRLTGLKGM